MTLEVKSWGNQRVKYYCTCLGKMQIRAISSIKYSLLRCTPYVVFELAGTRAIHTAVSVSRAAEGRRGISTGPVNLVRDQ